MDFTKKSYDIVVVGCGPCGAAAGKYAAELGAKTLMIDKKREIGLPVYEAASALYDLGWVEQAAGVTFNRSKVVEGKLHGIALFSPSGVCGDYVEMPDACMVRRPELEKALALAASGSGAEIWLDTKFLEVVYEQGEIKGVLVQRGGRLVQIACRGVIAADGAYARVMKGSGLSGFGAYTVSLGKDFAGVRDLKPTEHPVYESYMVPQLKGYACWVIPHGDGLRSVGVAHQTKPGAPNDRTLREVLERFIEHLEAIGRYDFSSAAELSVMAGTSTPVADVEALSKGKLVLAGDTAWRPQVGSPWGGTGISLAVQSGRFAAQQLVKALDAPADAVSCEYRQLVEATYPNGAADIQAIKEAKQWQGRLNTAPLDLQEKAVREVGRDYSALTLYLHGGYEFGGCAKRLEQWWQQNG